jgi:hypothetical protein
VTGHGTNPPFDACPGSLRRALPAWKSLISNKVILRIVESGYRIPFHTLPPLTRNPPGFQFPADPDKRRALQEEVVELLRKRAIEIADPNTPGFYSRLFAVPKRGTSKWRPILDLSFLNGYITCPRFKMETIASVRLAIRREDWVTSVDLRDAYQHVDIHPSSRRYLRFRWDNTLYQYTVLPFGLSTAPLVFTKVTKELASLVHREGIRLRMYLDDWLTPAPSQSSCLNHSRRVTELTERLGFQIRLEKSELTPTQSFQYLGMQVDTVAFTVSPSRSRLADLWSLLTKLRKKSVCKYRTLLSLLGKMESVSRLLPLARAHKRPLQRGVAARVSPLGGMDQLIPLGEWFREATLQWTLLDWLNSAVPIQSPKPDVYLYTDASKLGWGAHTLNWEARGVWLKQEASHHINQLELEAVRRALKAAHQEVTGKSVVVCGDNTTTLSYLRQQGGTRSSTMSIMAENILQWCQDRNTHLTVSFVPGRLNTVADLLSRSSQVLQTEWTIAHHALNKLWSAWGRSMVDLFANRFTHRLPLYVSPVRDTAAIAVDAFAMTWEGLDAYAYPPTTLLPRVIAKYVSERPRLILVAPFWPPAPWFPELSSLSHVPPIPLGLDSRSLIQPRTGVGHVAPETLKLTAWLLCGRNCGHVA